jgi:hypothetical protein
MDLLVPTFATKLRTKSTRIIVSTYSPRSNFTNSLLVGQCVEDIRVPGHPVLFIALSMSTIAHYQQSICCPMFNLCLANLLF